MKNDFAFLFVLSFVFVCLTGCTADEHQKDDATSSTAASTTASATSTSAPEQQTTFVPVLIPENEIEMLIKSNLDILAENYPDEILDETGTINSKQFDEIVALGEMALPFLESFADRSFEDYANVSPAHKSWAVHAIYAITPAIYDLFFPSPNGKYTAIIKVGSFASFFNHGRSFNEVQMIENSTNTIIYKTELDNAYTIGGLFDVALNWSADSNFAVIDCNGRRSGSVLTIDMQAKSYVLLPGMEEAIKNAFPEKNVEDVIGTPRSWFSFDGWEDDKTVNISGSILLSEEYDYATLLSRYSYDLSRKKIVDMEYDFTE